MTWTFSAFADEAGGTIAEQIAALQRAGLHRVDLRNVDGHNIAALPLDVAQGVKRNLDAAKVYVQMFGSPIGKIDIADDFQSDLDKLEHLARLADVFNCRWVRIFSYFNKGGAPMDEWQRESLDRLRRLRDLAEKHSLVLYHENERHIFGDRCEQVQVIADELRDGQTFRLIFDFDNFNQSGDDVWANWRRLKGATDSFHFKDSTAPPKPMHVPLGEGNGRARDILADAVAMGWSGPVALEPHLAHSEAVLATGPSGRSNEALKDLGPKDAFHLAAETAKRLLDELGAEYN